MISLLALLLAVPDAAPAQPPYPASDKAEEVVRWVEQSTDLPKADIVLIGAGGVFALSADPAQPATPDGRLLRRLREEVTEPALAEKLGGRSFSATLTIDCAHYNSSLTDGMIYPGASLKGGPGKPLAGARWLAASSIYLYDLTGPICEKQPHTAPTPVEAPAPTPAPTEAAAPPPAEPTSVAAVPKPAAKAPAKPKPRPAVASAPAAAPAGPAATPAAPTEYWVQSGAFASEALARARFEALSAAVAPTPLVGPKIEKVPDQPLYRLLIGPYPIKSLAADACAALKRKNTACFLRAGE